MNKVWWKESVVYQIYPRSFKDSNGNGVGDLRGIIEKLDYLKKLGVDVLWLSPVYKSPNDDNGYDISDYQDIMDEFGTLADWEELVEGLHQRGIKLVMDLVVNHTSDEHAWFQQARQSKDNPYRDFYIWRPPKDGQEPNNWASFFGGSAWQYDEVTGEYYLHLFTKKQPDLNWENPKVRQAVYEMMHWWLKKGVDGFRMDVINLISKVARLPDVPGVEDGGRFQFDGRYFVNGPRLLEFLREMKQEVLSQYDILTVGETPMVTTQNGLEITHEESGALNMIFQFEHMGLDIENDPQAGRSIKPWRLTELKEVMTRWQMDLAAGGWNSNYLNNHDQPRAVSRFGDDGRYRVESAKMLATFIHLLQGTPYIYQGEEIGMTNVAFDSLDSYRDVATLNASRALIEERGISEEVVLTLIQPRSRDNARTPMQWDDGQQAGFTSGEPWIEVNPNYSEINVQQVLVDPNSVFYYYQKLIQLRKQQPVIVYGIYDLILAEDEQIYAFTRTLEAEQLLVMLNFSGNTAVFVLPSHLNADQPELLINNYTVDPAQAITQLTLRPYEARVYRL